MSDVTQILERVEQGDGKAAEELLPLVYEELRQLAAHKMVNELSGQTLQATALVHEAWLRLIGSQGQSWQGRTHFFGAAAESMRRILIENARRKKSLKRGAGVEKLDLDQVDVAANADEDALLAVNDALEKLALEDPRSAEVVKLRFFVGMSNAEAGTALGLSERSVKRCWTFARAWLYNEIRRENGGEIPNQNDHSR
jgi:RNA polymerase sigma factor (TIGR02999 family)